MYPFLMASFVSASESPFPPPFCFCFARILADSVRLPPLFCSVAPPAASCFCHFTLLFSCSHEPSADHVHVWGLCVTENRLTGAAVNAESQPSPLHLSAQAPPACHRPASAPCCPSLTPTAAIQVAPPFPPLF